VLAASAAAAPPLTSAGAASAGRSACRAAGSAYSETKPWHRRIAHRAGELAAIPTPVRRGLPIIGWVILIVAVVAIVVALGR